MTATLMIKLKREARTLLPNTRNRIITIPPTR